MDGLSKSRPAKFSRCPQISFHRLVVALNISCWGCCITPHYSCSNFPIPLTTAKSFSKPLHQRLCIQQMLKGSQNTIKALTTHFKAKPPPLPQPPHSTHPPRPPPNPSIHPPTPFPPNPPLQPPSKPLIPKTHQPKPPQPPQTPHQLSKHLPLSP